MFFASWVEVSNFSNFFWIVLAKNSHFYWHVFLSRIIGTE
jgi:hypothetical protein